MPTEPTPRQADCLRRFAERARTGVPPTLAELATALGLRSTQAVRGHVRHLVAAGYLAEGPPRLARRLRLTPRGRRWVHSHQEVSHEVG